MNEGIPPKVKVKVKVKKISRRRLLKGLVGAAVGLAVAACEESPPGQVVSTIVGDGQTDPLPLTEPSEELRPEKGERGIELTTLTKETIAMGQAMRTSNDEYMLNQVIPGKDILMANNPVIQKIRSKPFNERLLLAIGYLGVKENKRWSWPETPTCNTYAIDFLRLILTDKYIGTMFRINQGNNENEPEGQPWVIGYNSAVWNTDASIKAAGLKYRNIGSDILDKWMTDYGKKDYGWIQVTNQADLQFLLGNGYIGLGVTSKEKVAEMEKKGVSRYGHAFVVFSLDSEGRHIAITQATKHTPIHVFPSGSRDAKANPEGSEFNFWVRRMPPSETEAN